MHTTVLHDLRLVESMHGFAGLTVNLYSGLTELNLKSYLDFWPHRSQSPESPPCIFQGSAMPPEGPASKYHHTGYEFWGDTNILSIAWSQEKRGLGLTSLCASTTSRVFGLRPSALWFPDWSVHWNHGEDTLKQRYLGFWFSRSGVIPENMHF